MLHVRKVRLSDVVASRADAEPAVPSRLRELLAEREAHREKAWGLEERGFTRELTRDERRQLEHERRKADEAGAAISRLPLEHSFALLTAAEADVRDVLPDDPANP